MEKSNRPKGKNKKQPTAKPKTEKKRRKSEGPTCSMFLSELSKRLAAKRREETESPTNIIHAVIESITNALPIKITVNTNPVDALPIKNTIPVFESLKDLSPELLPNDTLFVPYPEAEPSQEVLVTNIEECLMPDTSYKMPKMPVVNSEVIKAAAENETRRRRETMVDATTTTAPEHDVASELAKHVNTLKKISLIAEEFNQKTAKNLKEIVDSVQEDLIKKLEEVRAEQRARQLAIQEQEENG